VIQISVRPDKVTAIGLGLVTAISGVAMSELVTTARAIGGIDDLRLASIMPPALRDV
jgi:hypothetical protein